MRWTALERHADRGAWLAARGVGSSDVPAILGRSSYRGPTDAWRRLTGRERPSTTTADQRRGVAWEPWVLTLYGETTGREVRRPPPASLYRDPDRRWATASPDAFARDDDWGIVEAKTDRHADSRWGEPGTIERWTADAASVVRPDYALQAYWQAAILDAPWVDLAVLAPFFELRVYRLVRDLDVERELLAAIGDWYARHVERDVPPPPDGSQAAGEVLAELFGGGAEPRPATPYEVGLALNYELARQSEERAKAARKLLGQQLVAAAGDARALALGGKARVTIVRQPGRKYLDEAALLEAHPEIDLNLYRRPGAPSIFPRIYGLEG